MWPFKSETPVPVAKIEPKHIENALDELGLVRLNDLQGAMDLAMQKHLDPASFINGDDQQAGGHFSTEFNLQASAGRMKSLYSREPWVYTATSLISRTLSTVPFDVYDKATGEIDEQHPLNAQLKAGNQVQDHLSMDWSGNIDLVLSGNFVQVLDNGGLLHIPIELVTLEPSKTAQDLKKVGPIKGITVTGSLGSGFQYLNGKFFPWEDVIHFKLPNPYNPFVGFSMIAAASRPILLDRYKGEFEQAFYLRGATNAGVIETTEDMTKTRMDRLMRTFENAFTGRRNWWRTLFLPKGAKWVNSGLTMTEMQHLEGLRENRLTLLATIGVPPSQVGIVQDVNRATSEAQERLFWQNTIMPLAHMKAAGWNNSFLVKRKYRGEVEVRPNFDGIEAVEGGILTRAEQAKSLDNIATINEQRRIAGLAPLRKSDPRGAMFLIELVKSISPNPFSVEQPAVLPEDMGPMDEPVGVVSMVQIDRGTEDAHTHSAEIDEIGNGRTTGTDGEHEPHEHEITGGIVGPGDDGHTHPDVDLTVVEDEKIFRKLKASAVDSQERVEEKDGDTYSQALDKYFDLKLAQSKQALKEGLTDMRVAQAQGSVERQALYVKQALPVLEKSMANGFTIAQSQTRSFTPKSKQTRFNATDEVAIEMIKNETEDERKRRLKERGFERFLGFDDNATEAIQRLVEEGLEQGKTLEEISTTITNDFKESYKDQAFTIARTETLSAISEGLAWQHDTLSEVFTEVGKQWFHVGDGRSNPDARERHVTFQKAGIKGVVPGDHVWVDVDGSQLRYPRDPTASASSIINCRCSMVSVIPKTAQSNAETIIGRG